MNERDGVLILSENAGSHQELSPWALCVNPFDIQAQADAIYQALTMHAYGAARADRGPARAGARARHRALDRHAARGPGRAAPRQGVITGHRPRAGGGAARPRGGRPQLLRRVAGVGRGGQAAGPRPLAAAAGSLSAASSCTWAWPSRSPRPPRRIRPSMRSTVLRWTRWRRGSQAAGYPVQWDDVIAGTARFYVHDPFGNRLELSAQGMAVAVPHCRQVVRCGHLHLRWRNRHSHTGKIRHLGRGDRRWVSPRRAC